MVYDPVIRGKRYQFGVSGRLYLGNLLLFDRETESLWSQLLSEAVTGALVGARLKMLPALNTTWGAWKGDHPTTSVLSFQTGYGWNYRKNPYMWLGPQQEMALVVLARGESRIYPFSALSRSRSPIVDHVGGEMVKILYDPRTRTVRVEGRAASWYTGFCSTLRRAFPRAKSYR